MADTLPDSLRRIHEALLAGADALRPFTSGSVEWESKSDRGDPVTAADLAVDSVLRDLLPREDEGWLSEETADDRSRLDRQRVWVVDPVDGTREFVDGIPEWCVSIGLVDRGVPVAGGILNPSTGELMLGAEGFGVTLDGRPVRGGDIGSRGKAGRGAAERVTGPSDPVRSESSLNGARILASRSEVRRGEWDRFDDAPFLVVPCGSVAYKLGLVAVGRADATWTLVPKHEWDVAAGVALIRAAGLEATFADGSVPVFNRSDPRLPNLLAGPSALLREFRARWPTERVKGKELA